MKTKTRWILAAAAAVAILFLGIAPVNAQEKLYAQTVGTGSSMRIAMDNAKRAGGYFGYGQVIQQTSSTKVGDKFITTITFSYKKSGK
jgi:hypothetical protein